MKAIFVFSTLILTFHARASWFQTYCSNGESTIQIARGHDENFVSLTKKRWDRKSRTYIKTIVQLDLSTIKYSDSQVTALEETSNFSCYKNGVEGLATWKQVTAQNVAIAKRDGTSFMEDMPGISQDKRSINAFVICEHNGNGEGPCSK